MAGLGLEVRSIEGIAQQRMADMGQMERDLVVAAVFELSGPECRDRLAVFFFSSRRRHTRYWRDWSSDVRSSDLRRDGTRPRDQSPARAADERRRRGAQ